MGFPSQVNYVGKLSEIAELDFASEFDMLLASAGYELPRDEEKHVNIIAVVLEEGYDIEIVKKDVEE